MKKIKLGWACVKFVLYSEKQEKSLGKKSKDKYEKKANYNSIDKSREKRNAGTEK